MPERIQIDVPGGVTQFHWIEGKGRIRVSFEFTSKEEALQVFSQLELECDLIKETLKMELTPRKTPTNEIPPPPEDPISQTDLDIPSHVDIDTIQNLEGTIHQKDYS